MTIERIIREIDARLVSLIQKRDELETKRNGLRFLKPYHDMSDKELDTLPHSSEFWRKWNRYSNKIYILEHEIRLLREMKYAYEHHD